jgi:SAM-dependent methyltransferase
MITCPLCFQAIHNTLYHTDKNRDYRRCNTCCLVFVPEVFFLNKEDEKARYDNHKNTPDDLGYVTFLSQLTEPLLECLDTPSHGLDFGSGPGPCLHLLLEAKGHTMSVFDIYYANDPECLERQYDFITATEVVEHLSLPGKVLDELWALLRPGGVLAIMTQPVPEVFENWWYKNDLSHVSFFHQQTFAFLKKKWGAVDLYQKKSVWIMKKPIA